MRLYLFFDCFFFLYYFYYPDISCLIYKWEWNNPIKAHKPGTVLLRIHSMLWLTCNPCSSQLNLSDRVSCRGPLQPSSDPTSSSKKVATSKKRTNCVSVRYRSANSITAWMAGTKCTSQTSNIWHLSWNNTTLHNVKNVGFTCLIKFRERDSCLAWLTFLKKNFFKEL